MDFLRGTKQALEVLVSIDAEAGEFLSVPVNSSKDFRRFCESLSISKSVFLNSFSLLKISYLVRNFSRQPHWGIISLIASGVR